MTKLKIGYLFGKKKKVVKTKTKACYAITMKNGKHVVRKCERYQKKGERKYSIRYADTKMPVIFRVTTVNTKKEAMRIRKKHEISPRYKFSFGKKKKVVKTKTKACYAITMKNGKHVVRKCERYQKKGERKYSIRYADTKMPVIFRVTTVNTKKEAMRIRKKHEISPRYR
jgi:hypothetical protein